MDLKDMGWKGSNWIRLSQDREKWSVMLDR